VPGTRPKPTSAPIPRAHPAPSEQGLAPGAFRRARLYAMPTAPPAERVASLLQVLTAPPPSSGP